MHSYRWEWAVTVDYVTSSNINIRMFKAFFPQSSIQLCPQQRHQSHEALADIMLLPYLNKSSGLLAHESRISVFRGTLVVDQFGSRGDRTPPFQGLVVHLGWDLGGLEDRSRPWSSVSAPGHISQNIFYFWAGTLSCWGFLPCGVTSFRFISSARKFFWMLHFQLKQNTRRQSLLPASVASDWLLTAVTGSGNVVIVITAIPS